MYDTENKSFKPAICEISLLLLVAYIVILGVFFLPLGVYILIEYENEIISFP